MAEADLNYSKENAVRTRQCLSMPATFNCLENLNSLPDSFTANRFRFKAKLGVFDIEELLKVWISVGTKAGDQECLEIDQDDEVDIDCKEFDEALERLNNTLKTENIEALKIIQKKHWKKSQPNEERPEDAKRHRLSEDQIISGIGIHLIKKLSGKALSTPTKCAVKCPCGCTEKLDEERNMCIGSAETWHGQLDLISLGVGVAVTGDPIHTEKDDEEGEGNPSDDVQAAGDAAEKNTLKRSLSNGKRTNLEFKQDVSGKELAGQLQVISQCIVFGWTEYNRHRNKSPFIPSLYIDASEFQCYIYNPLMDYLLIGSHSTGFIDEELAPLDPLDKYSGIFFLWLILHHRLFFKKQIPSLLGLDIECGFHKYIELEPYRRLKDFKDVVKTSNEGMNVTKRTCLKIIPGKSPEKSKKRKRSQDWSEMT